MEGYTYEYSDDSSMDSITFPDTEYPGNPYKNKNPKERGISKDKLIKNTIVDHVLTQESEFDIDDNLLYSDDEYDEDYDDPYINSSFIEPISTIKERKGLSKGSVPNLKYECLTTQNIFENMLAKVHHLQPIFNIPPEDILILLQHYDWNEERLLEVWTDRMDGLLIEIGINPSSGNISSSVNSNGQVRSIPDIVENKNSYCNNQTETNKNENEEYQIPNARTRDISFKNNFFCTICCEEKSTETFSLECNHEYCISCYRHYIEDRLYTGNIINCMGCTLALKNDDIDKIMGYPSSTKLMLSSIKSFISKHNRNYKWCPFADCNCIIHLKDTSSLPEYSRLHYSPFVKCTNLHKFCFICGFEIHAPADCIITNEWIKKARVESENLNWVLSHTKECPKCSVNIEKDGGCNHMVCSSCKYEFCWICEGDWAPHGNSFYQCTLYKNDDNNNNNNNSTNTNSITDINKSLKKYTFYYKMFNEHEVSAKLDWKLGQNVGNKVKELQEKLGISWIEGQFLTDSIRMLNEGRTALKWSFAVAFYSDASHNLTKIFIDNQSLLSKAVEDLSELLQIKDPEIIMKRKTDFYNKTGYVENRTFALIECGRDLLCKGICKAN